ncbi:sod_Ni_protease, nickel-type superoxide dismutase maturation protease [actinobacterium SCGC AAA044-D11]
MSRVHFSVAKIFKAVEVRGESMLPNYNDGDWLLFRLLPAKSKAKSQTKSKANELVGKVVLIQRESEFGTDFLQVKRVTQVHNDNDEARIWVEGDNKSASTDSRNWGALDSDEVIGKLILRYRRASIK